MFLKLAKQYYIIVCSYTEFFCCSIVTDMLYNYLVKSGMNYRSIYITVPPEFAYH